MLRLFWFPIDRVVANYYGDLLPNELGAAWSWMLGQGLALTTLILTVTIILLLVLRRKASRSLISDLVIFFFVCILVLLIVFAYSIFTAIPYREARLINIAQMRIEDIARLKFYESGLWISRNKLSEALQQSQAMASAMEQVAKGMPKRYREEHRTALVKYLCLTPQMITISKDQILYLNQLKSPLPNITGPTAAASCKITFPELDRDSIFYTAIKSLVEPACRIIDPIPAPGAQLTNSSPPFSDISAPMAPLITVQYPRPVDLGLTSDVDAKIANNKSETADKIVRALNNCNFPAARSYDIEKIDGNLQDKWTIYFKLRYFSD